MKLSSIKPGKKTYIALAIGIFLWVFFAPWLWFDNGEDNLESTFFKGRERELYQKPIEECREVNCDGSCYKLVWVPFGARVTACAEDWYFISFWGQKFHMQSGGDVERGIDLYELM